MLSREDFVFTIGYDGPAAVIDKQAKRKYGKLSTRELVEKGLFRAAYSSAVYADSKEEKELVADAFTRLQRRPEAGLSMPEADFSTIDRLFGVFLVDVKRSIYI